MPREHVGLKQFQVILELCISRSKKRIEDPAHGEHRRTGVDALAGHIKLAHLATGFARAFYHGDRMTRGREFNRGGQSPDACAYNQG
ncbi:MAG: hypothetical protein Cons2KO_25620 [Congregibacter sp.]